MDELLAIWKREAQAALGVRQKGTDIEIYKVVAERRVSSYPLNGNLKSCFSLRQR